MQRKDTQRILAATSVVVAILMVVSAAGLTQTVDPVPPEAETEGTLVVVDEPLPRSVGDNVTELTNEMDLRLDRQDVRSPSEVLDAIADAHGVLVIVGHGDEDGLETPGGILGWATLADAVNRSPATGAVLVGCYSQQAAELIDKPVHGYDALVDARVAELDAFEQVVRQLHEDGAPQEAIARSVIREHVQANYEDQDDLLLRLISPQDPLEHDDDHDGPHHAESDEEAYEDEVENGASGNALVSWYKVAFSDYPCGSNSDDPLCDYAETMVFDAGPLFEEEECTTLVSIYDLYAPGSGKLMNKILKRLNAKGDLLALQLCGMVWFGVTEDDQVEGGGSLNLRFGTFVEFDRWFMEFEVAVYIQGGFDITVRHASGADNEVYVEWEWHIDMAVEGELFFVYFDAHKNIARGGWSDWVCYRNCGSEEASASSSENDGVRINDRTRVTEAYLVPGPAMAKHMEANDYREALGIPPDVELTDIRLDLTDERVRDVYEADLKGEPLPSASSSSGEGEECIQQSESSPLAPQVCVRDDGSIRAGASSKDIYLESGSPTNRTWKLLRDVGGEPVQNLYDVVNEAGTVPVAGSTVNETEKAAFDAKQVTETPGCFLTMVDGDVQQGDCDRFHHMWANATGRIPVDRARSLEDAAQGQIGLHGGLIVHPDMVTLDDGPNGIVKDASDVE